MAAAARLRRRGASRTRRRARPSVASEAASAAAPSARVQRGRVVRRPAASTSGTPRRCTAARPTSAPRDLVHRPRQIARAVASAGAAISTTGPSAAAREARLPGDQFPEARQLREHVLGRRTEIEQARDLVDANRREPIDERPAGLDRAEQRARREEALVEETARTRRDRRATGCRCRRRCRGWRRALSTGRCSPSGIGSTARGRCACTASRSSPTNVCSITVTCPASGSWPCSRARPPVHRDFLGQLVDIVIEQMRQQVRADLAGAAERLRTAGGGHPQRQLPLHRRRIGANRDRRRRRRSSPRSRSPRHSRRSVSIPRNSVVAPVGILLRVAARSRPGSSPTRTTCRRVRPTGCRRPPTLRRSRSGLCSGRTTLPAIRRTCVRLARERRVQRRRIRIEAAEAGEVPLRQPDAREPVRVGEARRLERRRR